MVDTTEPLNIFSKFYLEELKYLDTLAIQDAIEAHYEDTGDDLNEADFEDSDMQVGSVIAVYVVFALI